MTMVVSLKKMPLTQKLEKGEKWSDYDLRTMVERDKNNPAVFMWSIGNEIGEANGDAHSLATVKTFGQSYQGC